MIVRHPTDAPPIVQHWGADLGPLSPEDLIALRDADDRQTPPGTLDAAWRPGVLPTEPDGWPGRPGLLLVRNGIPLIPRWHLGTVSGTDQELETTLQDNESGLRLTTRLWLEPGGLLGLQHVLSTEGEPVEVQWLEAVLPVPTRADSVTTFSGRWTREKAPQTTQLSRGSLARQTRRGRPGHDQPWLLALSDGEARARSGEVWAVHLAWPADVTYRTDRLPENPTLLGAGELLRPGEIVLEPGSSYTSPKAWFAWSPDGFDGVTHKFHTYLRSRPQHPQAPRPLVLNTWEAVYFDHNPAKVLQLAERAAEIGVERFVLDDGWFLARRNDTRGLGDWEVDRTVWPEGLEPLAERVRELGMQFGLWFEPEMVSLDSDLARAHPEWLLHDPAQVPSPAGLSWRTQYLLDLADPDAYGYLLERMSGLVAQLGLAFIKWDHNRDLVDARHRGRPGVHAQTQAALALMAELKARHPGLEIESCSSGGARCDLGAIEVADRVWASDSNDAVERQDIQRWTELLLPPELIGAHVGPPTAHSSGRTVDLSYRLATSLTGSAGFEWDVLQCDEEEVQRLQRFAGLYRELRGLLHSGTVVHTDVRDPALRVRGVVATDRRAGVWTIATVATLEDARPEPVRLHGLDPDRSYQVRVREEIGKARWGWITPRWLSEPEVVLSGLMLDTLGLQIPALWPQQALVVHVTS
ncbi:alpha-galactosidase [Kineosporia babensis]|uniref:Alpha-galactosidase n=1 Tax=Kineosporia babensis TaxID=499548 RepID=A0A9X1NKG8_9ACTN|nr:alpha-galactosidase [Kineosporia babensis]